MTAPGTRPRHPGRTLVAMLAALLALAGPGCGNSGVSSRAGDGDLVLTLLPPGSAARRGHSRLDPGQRYPEGTRVVRMRPGNEVPPVELSEGMSAAGAPDVASDGASVVFTARRAGSSHWGIYEVRGGARGPRVVFEGALDCTDPAYLAADAIVSTCAVDDGTGEPVWSLFVSRRDDSAPERITFGVSSAFDPTPLRDGRILFLMERPAGTAGVPLADMFTVNPDGSLFEAFGDAHAAGAFLYRPRQAEDGAILLLGLDPGATAAQLLRVDLTRPDAQRPLDVAVAGADPALAATPVAVEPVTDGVLVVRRDGTSTAVVQLRPGEPATTLVSAVDGWTAVEAVPLSATQPPRGRPRIVGAAGEPGQVVGYDAGRSDGIVGPPQGSLVPHAVQFQIARAGRTHLLAMPVGAATPAGATAATGSDIDRGIPIAADRSFFFRLPADVPLRITTLDAGGDAIATSGWFWVRPGETRACFGCHEGHAAAPVNRRIEAITQPPIALEAFLEARVSPASRSSSSEGGQ